MYIKTTLKQLLCTSKPSAKLAERPTKIPSIIPTRKPTGTKGITYIFFTIFVDAKSDFKIFIHEKSTNL